MYTYLAIPSWGFNLCNSFKHAHAGLDVVVVVAVAVNAGGRGGKRPFAYRKDLLVCRAFRGEKIWT